MFDPSKLTPLPWKANFVDGTIDYANLEVIDFNDTDLEFIAIARNAFDVATRRGWGVARTHNGLWFVPAISMELEIRGNGLFLTDPFTALVEADRWYREHVEAKHETPACEEDSGSSVAV